MLDFITLYVLRFVKKQIRGCSRYLEHPLILNPQGFLKEAKRTFFLLTTFTKFNHDGGEAFAGDVAIQIFVSFQRQIGAEGVVAGGSVITPPSTETSTVWSHRA